VIEEVAPEVIEEVAPEVIEEVIEEVVEEVIEEVVEEVAPETEDEIIEHIKQLMRSTQNYSYLNCGRHLKDGVTKESLTKFHKEFISYGASNRTDSTILALLKSLNF
jgi:N-methylhydantoinase B/oxoprolinase/acetone carboxylase alpha subunit